MSVQGTFIWNELMAKDMDKSKAFYSGLLGWETADMPMSSGFYTLVKAGGEDRGGMFQITPEMGPTPQAWMAYIGVDDVDATAKKTSDLGGSVVREPFDIPGVGRIAIISDPDGGMVGLMTPVPRG